jgi:AcrR family transcriptional regulator
MHRVRDFGRVAPHDGEGHVTIKPRRRNARAVVNDAAISAAAVGEILRAGVDRLSLREVAQRAGLTHGAAYARYEDVSELLAELWQAKLASSALELLELSVRAVEERTEDSVRVLLDRVRRPRPEDIAMAEVLLVARRMPVVYEEVEIFIKKYVCTEEGLTGESRAHCARSLSLFGIAMFSIFEGHYFNDDQSYLDVVQGALVAALERVPDGAASGETVSDELTPPGQDDENLRAHLVYATYVVVGSTGYHQATISRIARRADCSPGAIYKLYRSKDELVLDSFRTIFGPSKESEPLPVIASSPETPSHGSQRRLGLRTNFALEVIIAAAHTDALRTTVGAHLRGLSEHLSEYAEPDDAEDSRTRSYSRSLSALDHGTQWMSALMEFDTPNFEEFSDSFRAALLNE